MTPAVSFALWLLWSGSGDRHVVHDRTPPRKTHGDGQRAEFRAQLTTKPLRVYAKSPTQLTLTVTDAKGKATRDFETAHTKLMHLIVVSQDLSVFAHLHPVLNQDRFTVTYAFPRAGAFRLFADFTPQRQLAQVVSLTVNVAGVTPRPVILAAESRRAKTVGPYLITLATRPQRLKAGHEAMLTFAVARTATRRPVEELEEYLGARGHCVIVREGAREFIHAHPIGDRPETHPAMPPNHQLPMPGLDPGSQVSFHATFPRTGFYKVWAQKKRHEKIFVADYLVNVQ